MLFKVVPLKHTNLVLVQTLTQNGLLKIGLQQQESGGLHVSQPLYALYYNSRNIGHQLSFGIVSKKFIKISSYLLRNV